MKYVFYRRFNMFDMLANTLISTAAIQGENYWILLAIIPSAIISVTCEVIAGVKN